MLGFAMVSQAARMVMAEADRVNRPAARRKLRRASTTLVSMVLDMSVLRCWVEVTSYSCSYALMFQVGFKPTLDAGKGKLPTASNSRRIERTRGRGLPSALEVA